MTAVGKSYNQQVAEQANKFDGGLKLTFPKVLKLAPIDEKNFPKKDFQSFILDGAMGQKYSVISYEGSQTGYHLTYLIASSTVESTWLKITNQASHSAWSKVYGISGDLYAASEFKNLNAGSQAKVTIFQRGKNVQVIIQSLTKPTEK